MAPGRAGSTQPGNPGKPGNTVAPPIRALRPVKAISIPARLAKVISTPARLATRSKGIIRVKPRNTVLARAGSTAARGIPAGNMAAPATRAARAISTPAQVGRTDRAARMVRAGVIRLATASSPSRAKPACLLASAWV